MYVQEIDEQVLKSLILAFCGAFFYKVNKTD